MQMIANNEKDVATLIDSMPEEIYRLIILLQRKKHLIFEHERHVLHTFEMGEIRADWEC
jgi:hypothetical protein